MRAERGLAARFIDVISRALDRCREVLAGGPPAPPGVWEKDSVFGWRELVTAADLAVQDILAGACAAAFPGIPVVAEESCPRLGVIPPSCVIIDPVDGTVPFLNGSPCYTITVCLAQAGRPVAAAVDLPAYGVRVLAREGQGAQARGSTGRLPCFGPRVLLASPVQAGAVRQAVRHAPGWMVRPLPTTSAKMVLAGLGRAGAAVRVRAATPGVAPWDYAAAALIVREAGGIVRDDQDRDLARTPPAVVNGWLACRDTETAQALRRIMTGAPLVAGEGDSRAV
jgi:fructose-1,6-bisphosphatase/inositol monophosphatase family enzyme